MNLFWETRKLTKQREDHLTCFLAAALELDASFRNAYETNVLLPIMQGDVFPRIKEVKIQCDYKEEHCRPDMILVLKDGRQVICEHKIDASETEFDSDDGKTLLQIERYLELPQIDAVAYFRPSLNPPDNVVLKHSRYLKPVNAPHFLWRDIYKPICAGKHILSIWLRNAFEELGFTPPVENIGKLWPDEDDDVKENQKNFGKLWHLTRTHLATIFKISSGRRCELNLEPHTISIIKRVYLSPLAQNGSLLRMRIVTDKKLPQSIQNSLSELIKKLPVMPQLKEGKLLDGTVYLDLLTSLQLMFSGKKGYEKILYNQVVPVMQLLNKK